MKRHLRERLWAKDGDPGPIAWAVAAISLVLPFAGLVLCLLGGSRAIQGLEGGWLLLGLGAAAITLDILIDFAWAHPGVTASDEPDLNCRGAQLVGRMAIIEEPIEGGRGKVRVGDTIWPAEGPDMAAGTSSRVIGARSTILVVEALNGGRQ